jgi:hypothetical protein
MRFIAFSCRKGVGGIAGGRARHAAAAAIFGDAQPFGDHASGQPFRPTGDEKPKQL